MLASIAHILCIPTHQHPTITMIIITILLYDDDNDVDDFDDDDIHVNDDDDSLHSNAPILNNHYDYHYDLAV